MAALVAVIDVLMIQSKAWMAGTSPAMTTQSIALGITLVLMAGGWVYFMTNRRNGILYTGVTSNLPRRA
jgi:GIY-YIG catalytic domain